jgi:hypothetical protein
MIDAKERELLLAYLRTTCGNPAKFDAIKAHWSAPATPPITGTCPCCHGPMYGEIVPGMPCVRCVVAPVAATSEGRRCLASMIIRDGGLNDGHWKCHREMGHDGECGCWMTEPAPAEPAQSWNVGGVATRPGNGPTEPAQPDPQGTVGDGDAKPLPDGLYRSTAGRLERVGGDCQESGNHYCASPASHEPIPAPPPVEAAPPSPRCKHGRLVSHGCSGCADAAPPDQCPSCGVPGLRKTRVRFVHNWSTQESWVCASCSDRFREAWRNRMEILEPIPSPESTGGGATIPARQWGKAELDRARELNTTTDFRATTAPGDDCWCGSKPARPHTHGGPGKDGE